MLEKNELTQRERERTRARSLAFRYSAALLMPEFIFGRRTADNFLGDIIIIIVVVVVVVEVL